MLNLTFLAKKEELAFAKTRFQGKWAGKAWKFQLHLNGLIRTRAVILALAILICFNVIIDYLTLGVIPGDLLAERVAFSLIFAIAGLCFNRFRVASIVAALLPVGLLLGSYLTVDSFDVYTIGFLGAVFLTISLGFCHNYELKRLRRQMAPAIPKDK